MNEKILNRKNIIYILLICFLSSISIDFISHLPIKEYIKIFMLPFTIMIISYSYLIYHFKLNQKKYSLLFIPIFLILINGIFFEIDGTNMFLNIILLPILITILLFDFVNKNFKLSKELLLWCFKLFPQGLIKNLVYIKNIIPLKKKSKTIFNIILGLIIGLPIAGILIVLLINADQYFNELIIHFLNIFKFKANLSFFIDDIIFIGIIFLIFYTIFINLIKNKNIPRIKIENHEINPTIITTILTIINSVFILFLISEISKQTNNFLALPMEYTYAQYAREGFFQLLAITVINFSILLYTMYFTNLYKNRNVKKRLLLLIFFTILLIFNSYYRMFLYMNEFGFTILRLQVILFLAMELLLIFIILKKICSNLKHQDANIFITIILIFYIINIYFCIDPFINFLNHL